MTREDKQILLTDLCARLSYGVKVLCLRDFNHDWYNLEMVDIGDNEVYVTTYEPYANRYVEIEAVKPYLFPLSNMTEEQKNVYHSFYVDILRGLITPDNSIKMIDWLTKNHFDYRGLIKKGLAIDCTNLNIY